MRRRKTSSDGVEAGYNGFWIRNLSFSASHGTAQYDYINGDRQACGHGLFAHHAGSNGYGEGSNDMPET